LYVIAAGRLDTLWWSMLLPLLFLMSSFFVGPAMATVESFLSARTHGRRPPTRALQEMLRLSAGIMVVYLGLKLGDLAWRGALPALVDGSVQSTLYLVEVGAGVLLPIILLLLPRVRSSPAGALTASVLVVLGVALNRANVVFTGMAAAAGGASYVPYWMEFAVTLGIIAAGILAYLFVTENFPIYREIRPEPPSSVEWAQLWPRQPRELRATR